DFPRGSMRSGTHTTRSARFTFAQFEQIRKRQQAFTDVLAWSATRFNLAQGGEMRGAVGLFVSGNFFSLLGVPAIVGRTFTPADDNAACAPTAVISHAFWQREFAGDPSVVGRIIRLDGHPFTILGVTSPSFYGLEVGTQFDVTVPL